MLIAPSLLSCPLDHIRDHITALEKAGADLFHIDIMDGHYVPNMSFGPGFVKSIAAMTTLPLDVHLMVSDPRDVIPWFIEAGASSISFHPETDPYSYELLHIIKKSGVKAGIVINPDCAVEDMAYLLTAADYVVVMTVKPGFGGQKIKLENLQKITEIRAINPGLCIAVDGGVTLDNAPLIRPYNPNILIAGNSIFQTADYAHTIAQLKSV